MWYPPGIRHSRFDPPEVARGKTHVMRQFHYGTARIGRTQGRYLLRLGIGPFVGYRKGHCVGTPHADLPRLVVGDI